MTHLENKNNIYSSQKLGITSEVVINTNGMLLDVSLSVTVPPVVVTSFWNWISTCALHEADFLFHCVFFFENEKM